MFVSPQASVRLTLATLLYSGKSPDGHHILVSAVQLTGAISCVLAHTFSSLTHSPVFG